MKSLDEFDSDHHHESEHAFKIIDILQKFLQIAHQHSRYVDSTIQTRDHLWEYNLLFITNLCCQN